MGDPQVPIWLCFLFGGASGMLAISVVQPNNLVKNRMQISGPCGRRISTRTMIAEIYKAEGLIGFYKGMSAALCSQAIYTTGRMGCFYSSFEVYKHTYGVPSFPMKITLGMVAGAFGALLGNPADVALVRMTCDGWMPKQDRRNYRNVVDAIKRIVDEEGVKALFRGAYPAMVRSMIINGAQFGSYTQAREMLFDRKRVDMQRYLMASMISGFVTTTASLPVDIIKTRVQNSKEDVTIRQVFTHLVRTEGVFALWKGFWPSFLVIAPYTVVTFVLLEEFYSRYFKFVGEDPKG